MSDDYPAIRKVLAAYRSTEARISEEEIQAAWVEFDGLRTLASGEHIIDGEEMARLKLEAEAAIATRSDSALDAFWVFAAAAAARLELEEAVARELYETLRDVTYERCHGSPVCESCAALAAFERAHGEGR